MKAPVLTLTKRSTGAKIYIVAQRIVGVSSGRFPDSATVYTDGGLQFEVRESVNKVLAALVRHLPLSDPADPWEVQP